VMKVFVDEMKHFYLGSAIGPLNKILRLLRWIVTHYV